MLKSLIICFFLGILLYYILNKPLIEGFDFRIGNKEYADISYLDQSTFDLQHINDDGFKTTFLDILQNFTKEDFDDPNKTLIYHWGQNIKNKEGNINVPHIEPIDGFPYIHIPTTSGETETVGTNHRFTEHFTPHIPTMTKTQLEQRGSDQTGVLPYDNTQSLYHNIYDYLNQRSYRTGAANFPLEPVSRDAITRRVYGTHLKNNTRCFFINVSKFKAQNNDLNKQKIDKIRICIGRKNSGF